MGEFCWGGHHRYISGLVGGPWPPWPPYSYAYEYIIHFYLLRCDMLLVQKKERG